MSAPFGKGAATTFEWASMYRGLGLQVTPAHMPGEVEDWKRPFGDWKKYQDALVSDDVFDRWFHPETGQHRARRNMGLILGAASGGLFAIDLDAKPGTGAFNWWERLLREHTGGEHMRSWKQATGGGGRQILFRSPPGWVPPTFKTKLCVDLRGQGGFIICPPSLHASGHSYNWLHSHAPWMEDPMTAPDWLCAEIEALRLQYGGSPGGASQEHTASPERALDAWGRDVDGREDKILRTVWAAIVDLRRESPLRPSQGEQDAELGRIWEQYARTTRSRLSGLRGESNEELLEREGRGFSEFLRKWAYGMGQWDGKVAEAAKVERPDPFGGDESGPDSNLPETLAEPDTSEPLDAGDFHGQAPERRWLIQDWIALNEVNSLYGMGGLGKTLLAQQLTYALVTGERWLGLNVEPCAAVLAIFCEDRADELHRRHDAIKLASGHVLGNPYAGAHLWPRYGLDNAILSYRQDTPIFGAFHERLKTKLETLNPGLLILDTIRDVYVGDECDPAKVNAFLKTVLGGLILGQQARGYDLTILLLGHPSMMGQKEGYGVAGTLAWENGVRSRLYLGKPDDGGADERTLTRGKANYASSGESTALRIVWANGVFETIGDAEKRQVRDLNLVRTIQEKVEFAWASGRPYMERRTHERALHSLLTAQLQDGCNVSRAVALQAIRETIEEGLIYLSKNSNKRGWRAENSQ
jgi:hypothetical protein